jgi:chemotaxis protein CheZ
MAYTVDKSLAQQLEATASGNTVTHDVMVGIVDDIIKTLHGDINATDIKVYKQLQELKNMIDSTRLELANLSPNDITEEHISLAADQLDEIVRHTEEATSKILDAAETVQNVAGSLDAANADKLNAAVTTIYEASNFQDITGQRITKVVKTLQIIEDRLNTMVVALGGEIKKSINGAGGKRLSAADINKPDTLMNGPQLPGSGINQDDIDALFDSL